MRFVEFKDVCKSYKMGDMVIKANENVNFYIEKGEFAIIVGASGAGKTTVLNLLGGMDTVTSGEITVDNENVAQLKGKRLTEYRRGDIGFVFQFYNLMPNLTARENVEIASQLCKNAMSPEEVLESVGLGDRMDNFPAQLSGGEQQRVAIARALAKRPKLLLCDEPTGALDYKTGKSVLRLLQTACRENGMTVIVITHNQSITPIADRIITMRSGTVESIKVNEMPVDVAEIEW